MLPARRLEVIGEVGGCIVLIGTFGLFVVPHDECTAERFNNMLNDAAQAGALVGGLVDTYHDGSPVHQATSGLSPA